MTWSPRSSIRSEVTVALLAVALVPLAALAAIAYQSQRSASRADATDRLAGIAVVQEERIDAYVISSLEGLALVSSRTQLRRSLRSELADPAPANVELMTTILADAVSASSAARRIELISLEGVVIASSDGQELGKDHSQELFFRAGLERATVTEVTARDGELVGAHAGPISLDGELLGVAFVQADLTPLQDLISDYTGLGETGESVLIQFSATGEMRVLGDLRFNEEYESGLVVRGRDQPAITTPDRQVSSVIDYRDQDVFAVRRPIETAPGWVLVVKIDQAEALSAATRLRNILALALLVVAAAIIAVAIVLARKISQPIVDLRDTAVAVAGGDNARRAHVVGSDELSELGVEFNRMTDELTAANARLALTNEQLEEFVFISSHDLKSPLRSISSFAQLLETRYGSELDDDGQEYLGYIRSGAARMHEVIEDLLTYLRIEKEEHQTTSVDPNSVIDRVLALHRPLIDQAHGHVEVGELAAVEGNEPLLNQLFDNLIQNAIRYRRPDQDLMVKVTSTTKDDQVLTVVADNGTGVAAERREEAFEVFRRLSDSPGGTGMGLAICRRIARRQGGDVWMADSELGGVAVVISLPAATNAPPGADADRAQPQGPVSA